MNLQLAVVSRCLSDVLDLFELALLVPLFVNKHTQFSRIWKNPGIANQIS